MSESVVRYKYQMQVETSEHCHEIAQTFHDKLKDNPDYVENRVLLNYDETQLTFVEFADSESHWRVVSEEGRWPVLERIDVEVSETEKSKSRRSAYVSKRSLRYTGMIEWLENSVTDTADRYQRATNCTQEVREHFVDGAQTAEFVVYSLALFGGVTIVITPLVAMFKVGKALGKLKRR